MKGESFSGGCLVSGDWLIARLAGVRGRARAGVRGALGAPGSSPRLIFWKNVGVEDLKFATIQGHGHRGIGSLCDELYSV